MAAIFKYKFSDFTHLITLNEGILLYAKMEMINVVCTLYYVVRVRSKLF